MKSITNFSAKWILFTIASIFTFSNCKKDINQQEPQNEVAGMAARGVRGHLKQTNTFSSEVVLKWLDLNRRLLTTTTRTAPGVKSSREFGYTGIALYESVVPGMPTYQSVSSQLNQLPAMPETQPGLAYHWAASANAALAAMNRYFFPTTSAANKAAIDSLESALNLQYLAEEATTGEIDRSNAFGKEVARRIFEWSNSDGSDHAFDAYTLPVGPGLYTSPPPAFPALVAPYWGNNRTLVPGSIEGALPPAPIPYSEDPSSDYYKMEKEVYDVSLILTADQKAAAQFWLDAAIGVGGHWQSILRQVIVYKNAKLDIAALAYAKGGIYANDAGISTFRTKYTYNTQRPGTYIRTVLNHPTWNSLLSPPGHPDYSSAHTVQSTSIASALGSVFGQDYPFTDHTFDNLGMAPRTYNSFRAVAEEIAMARVYAGIHTRPACEAGLQEGSKVAQNIDSKLKFLKE